MQTTDKEKLDLILQTYNYDPASLIPIMQAIQKEYRYLPEEMLTYVAKQLKVSEARIYGVATFYADFSLEPKGKYVIKVCDGTACHVRKSIPVIEAFQEELHLSEGHHTTEDMLFTLEVVACLGACSLAPACTVNDVVHATMNPKKVKQLIKKIREEEAHEN